MSSGENTDNCPSLDRIFSDDKIARVRGAWKGCKADAMTSGALTGYRDTVSLYNI